MSRRTAVKWIVSVALLAATQIVQPVASLAYNPYIRNKDVKRYIKAMERDMPKCAEIAKQKYYPVFAAVEKATGFPKEDIATFAFKETRMGLVPTKDGIVEIEDATFLELFEKYAPRHLGAIRKHDPVLARKVQSIVNRKDPKRGYKKLTREILALRKSNAYLSLILVAARAVEETGQVDAHARRKGLRLPKTAAWLLHSRGPKGAKDLLNDGRAGLEAAKNEAIVYDATCKKFKICFAEYERKSAYRQPERSNISYYRLAKATLRGVYR